MGEFAQMLLSLQPKELVLIDPFLGWMTSGDADGNNERAAFLPAIYEMMRDNIMRDKADHVIKLHKGFSYDVLLHYPELYFDMIYIDGDHSYEGCKRDLYLASRKVKEGGLIMGHDYTTNSKCKNKYNFGVKRAVDEFCEEKGWEIIAFGNDGCVSYVLQKIRPH